MNAVFYGFQFPHHGEFSSFKALSREFNAMDVQVCHARFPITVEWLPGRLEGAFQKKWFELNEYQLRAAFTSGRLVHYFYPENSLFKAPAWKRTGPLVLTCHQPVEQLMDEKVRLKRKYLFKGLREADAVLLMASCELDAYRELAPQAKVFCIPHGVNTEFFSPKQAAENRSETFRILTIGNWLRDYDVWAKTVERVMAKCSDVEFTVMANPDRLKAAAKCLGKQMNRIRILQGISDEQLLVEYRRADVVFLPLLGAWANNSLLESMSCGRAVLVTDLPATREYAGDAAEYIDKGDADSAAHGLLKLYEMPAIRLALGDRAERRMRRYGWRRIAEKHTELYNALLGRKISRMERVTGGTDE